MREIKFRGKGLYDGKWYYGDLVSGDRIIDYNDEDIMNEMYMDGSGVIDGSAKMIDEKTIGQYTGLKDKNGKEIYEGDILECFRDGLAEVVFVGGSFGMSCNGFFTGFNDVYGYYEVVGNIHDNPELLE